MLKNLWFTNGKSKDRSISMRSSQRTQDRLWQAKLCSSALGTLQTASIYAARSIGTSAFKVLQEPFFLAVISMKGSTRMTRGMVTGGSFGVMALTTWGCGRTEWDMDLGLSRMETALKNAESGTRVSSCQTRQATIQMMDLKNILLT